MQNCASSARVCHCTFILLPDDSIVEGIWRHADPEHKLEFLLGQLSGHREWDWYHFMLNSSNHRPGIPVDWLSYHFCENALNQSVSYHVPTTRPDALNVSTKSLFSFSS